MKMQDKKGKKFCRNTVMQKKRKLKLQKAERDDKCKKYLKRNTKKGNARQKKCINTVNTEMQK